MEKKTKKLQLRKETIAVLNGEKMSRVVGGRHGYCEPPYEEFEDGECSIATPSGHCLDENTKSDNLCTHQTLCNQNTCLATVCYPNLCS